MKELLELLIIGGFLLTSFSLCGLYVHRECLERRSELQGYLTKGVAVIVTSGTLYYVLGLCNILGV